VSRTAPRTLPLPSGEPVPVLGQGTWGWVEDPRRRPDELAALRLGLDLGRSLLAAVTPGDVVSLHWDEVCDHLTPGQRDQLQRRTTDQLTLTNATATAQES
jgi:hypothetical protein